jgi:hypothetical protein
MPKFFRVVSPAQFAKTTAFNLPVMAKAAKQCWRFRQQLPRHHNTTKPYYVKLFEMARRCGPQPFVGQQRLCTEV